MKGCYSATEIAKYVINYCNDRGTPISNLKLQKILYFLWVDFYKRKQQPLFFENFYAWQLGPVLPEVYFNYCSYGGSSIENQMVKNKILDRQDKALIEDIVDQYRYKPAGKLVDDTHRKGGPWEKAFCEGHRTLIPMESIITLEANR